MYQRRHQRQSGFALMLLASQLFQVGFDRIPPVTLVSILGQVAIFLRLIPINMRWPAIGDICISTHRVMNNYDFKRLVMAPFFHLDDWHLYYNMVSFLWKGMHLERRMGSPYFAYLLAVFTVLTSAVTVGLGLAAAEGSGDQHYASQCAAGFSGVIFALKVLTTHDTPATQLVMGFLPVPGPLICWAELIIIQLITPNVSFIGHLAGIIVGLLYVKGPLKYIMDSVFETAPSYTYTSGTPSGPRRHGGGGGGGSGRAPPPPRGGRRDFPWPFNTGNEGRYEHEQHPSHTYHTAPTGTQRPGSPSAPPYNSPFGPAYNAPSRPQYDGSYVYTGGLSEEEQLQRAMEESSRITHTGHPKPSAPELPPDIAPPSYAEVTGDRRNLYPDLPPSTDPAAEMRQRRLARFT